MAVTGLMLDPTSNVPIVILRDLERTLFLPIWIGVAEAQAIALRMEGVAPPRPLTHDLLLQMCQRMGGSIEKIVISDLREGTFFAEIHLTPDEPKRILDARPSDAIALALRAEAPIFVRRAVLDQAQVVATALDPADDAERIRRVLEELNPNDPDRYTM
jgi:bifunctional DNase/RNase